MLTKSLVLILICLLLITDVELIALSDAAIQSITGAVIATVSAISTVLLAVLAYMTAKNTKAIKETKQAVEISGERAITATEDASKAATKVKETLEQNTAEVAQIASDRADVVNDKLEAIVKTGDITHRLVNSQMETQLRMVAELSRSKANNTKDKADLRAAEIAEKALAEHIKGQSQLR